MICNVSVGAILITSFLTSFPSKAICVASFIPNEIKMPTAMIQMANKLYLAIFPIDFKLVTNSFKPNIKKKNIGIPAAKRNKIP